MKFTIDKDELQKEIMFACDVITEKSASHITSCVFIKASADGALLIRATDTKRSLDVSIPADVEEEGAAVVFCDKFKSALQSLPAGDIDFASDGANATVKPQKRNAAFSFKTFAADKFPEIPSSEGVEFFDIPACSLKKMIMHTTFAASDDKLRYFLNGVYAEKDGSAFKLAATDGKRLAAIETKIEGAFPDFAGSIIHAGSLNMLNKRCPKEGLAAIGFNAQNAFFRIGNREFSSRLIDGQFPSYRRVIPEKQSRYMEIGRKDFSEALKRVGVLAEQKSGKVRLEMSQNTLKISSRENEIGNADEFVECEYDGEPFAIAANCAFIAEPVNAIECDKISLEFTSPRQAITIKGAGEHDFVHVVMPMLTGDEEG